MDVVLSNKSSFNVSKGVGYRVKIRCCLLSQALKAVRWNSDSSLLTLSHSKFKGTCQDSQCMAVSHLCSNLDNGNIVQLPLSRSVKLFLKNKVLKELTISSCCFLSFWASGAKPIGFQHREIPRLW